LIKALHKAKRLSFFIKLDISKAFDSVSWVFLLEILQALGCGQRWRDWIATSLATSSSKILLNRILGRQLKHARGLQQGDTLSPMPFILAIDPLHRLIDLAVHRGLLHPILPRAASLQCCLYADDAAIFANPDHNELHRLSQILNFLVTVLGSENRMESPNTRVANESAQVTKDGETKNLRMSVLTSKVVNPFTRALTPPFRETKGLLHSEITLESKEYS
jgi:hypothetical protein